MYLNNTTIQESLPLSIEETSVPSSPRPKPIFKPYNNRQGIMILDIAGLIPEHHVARVIDEFVEAINDEIFYPYFPGGGRASYHPKMMTKILLYAYSQKVYSCREIAKMTKENIPMMWLAAMEQPDFRTINRYRSSTLEGLIDELFVESIYLLLEQNYIQFDHYFLDGTKIEADANKYSFVWKKSAQKFDARFKEKIQTTLEEIHSITEMEEKELLAEAIAEQTTDRRTLEKIAASYAAEIDALTEQIKEEKDVETRKELRSKRTAMKKPAKKLEDDVLPNLEKYEQQIEICGEHRNSYSKTDNDATFMRTKDDHMKNGQLKPCYNVQMATENQFILSYSIHQNPTDTRCFIPHMDKLAASRLPVPKVVIADAGYGNETNYLYAQEGEDGQARFEFLIPFNTYLQEQKRSFKKDIKHVQNWTYIEEEDRFICPNERSVEFKRYSKRTDKYGYTRDFKIYECEDCSDCPLKELCTKAKGNRQVHYNPVYEELKAKAKKALEDEQLQAIYALRKIEVESVFGHLKGNRSFRRFSLRGMKKVHIEFGIVAMAHNLLKVAGIRQLLSLKIKENGKQVNRKTKIAIHLFYNLGAFWTAPFRGLKYV